MFSYFRSAKRHPRRDPRLSMNRLHTPGVPSRHENDQPMFRAYSVLSVRPRIPASEPNSKERQWGAASGAHMEPLHTRTHTHTKFTP